MLKCSSVLFLVTSTLSSLVSASSKCSITIHVYIHYIICFIGISLFNGTAAFRFINNLGFDKKPNLSTAQIPTALPFNQLACLTFLYACVLAKVVVAKAELNNTIFVFIDFSIPLTTPQISVAPSTIPQYNSLRIKTTRKNTAKQNMTGL